MTLRTPPSWLQNGSHPAENDRLTTQALWSRSGVMEANDLAVTQSASPGMSVQVAAGWAAVVGNYTTNMGTYVAYNDGAVTLSVGAANPSNPRIDLVVLTIQDAYYTGAANSVTFQVIAGTPAVSPVVPTVPTMSIPLAQIAVAAGATQILNANITNRRSRAAIYEATFAGSSASVTPLRIEAFSGQTGNLLSIANSSGTIIGWIDSSGTPNGTLAAGGSNPFFLMGA